MLGSERANHATGIPVFFFWKSSGKIDKHAKKQKRNLFECFFFDFNIVGRAVKIFLYDF
jgi:hypothetical protein